MEYRYQCAIRPANSWNTPEGEGRRFTEEDLPHLRGRGYGSVYYTQPLTPQQIEYYSLIALTQIQELDGKSFLRSYRNGESILYRITIKDDFEINVYSRFEENTDSFVISYPVLMLRIEQYNWQPGTDADFVLGELKYDARHQNTYDRLLHEHKDVLAYLKEHPAFVQSFITQHLSPTPCEA